LYEADTGKLTSNCTRAAGQGTARKQGRIGLWGIEVEWAGLGQAI